MVLFGVKFEEYFNLSFVEMALKSNAEKQVAQMLFDVKTTYIGTDILIIYKEFIATTTLNLIFAIFLIGSVIPFFIWGVIVPFIITSVFVILWSFLNSVWFNYAMFKIMVRKIGYKGRMRLL